MAQEADDIVLEPATALARHVLGNPDEPPVTVARQGGLEIAVRLDRDLLWVVLQSGLVR